jgi:SAM-dependent methyltransferase
LRWGLQEEAVAADQPRVARLASELLATLGGALCADGLVASEASQGRGLGIDATPGPAGGLGRRPGIAIQWLECVMTYAEQPSRRGGEHSTMQACPPLDPRVPTEVFALGLSWSEAARQDILGPILPRVTSACDLACGTGTTALSLARRGIRMSAVDLSPDMCRLARAKARRARVPLRVLRADMRDFRLPEAVDLVTCEFDALNHVPRKGDLALVAKSVARALRPGGYFYFDVNNRLAFERVWPLTWFIEKPGVAVVLHGGYDRGRDRAWSDVEWFIREGRVWRRYHEHVEEVCWTASEIRGTLREAGFGAVRGWDATPYFGESPTMQPGHRTIYLARKRTLAPKTRVDLKQIVGTKTNTESINTQAWTALRAE